MDTHEAKPEAESEELWPIVPPDPRFPFPPAIWTILNLLLAMLMTVPFIFVAGACAACIWAVDAMRSLLAAHIGYGAVLSTITPMMKTAICLFAMHMEYCMAITGGLTYLVRVARQALRDCDPSGF